MKRPLAMVALLYTGGVLVGEFLSLPVIWLSGCSLALAAAAWIWSRARARLLCLLLVFTGWTSLAMRTAVLAPDDLRTLAGTNTEYLTLRGRLTETPTQRVIEHRDTESWHTLARVEVTALQRANRWQPAFGRVVVTTPGVLDNRFFGGQPVEITGVLRPPKGPAADGLFDYRTYLRRQGIHYELRVERPEDWRLAASGGGPARPPLADRFRRWSQATLERGLPEQDESLRLLWAMSLGWTTALTGEVSEPFMRTGTMHIFAISGLHIALIAGILVAILRVLQVPRGLCGGLVLPAIWFYTAATGWQPSAIRSSIMMSVIIAGWSLRRPSDLVNSLAGAGFIILLWDPQQLFQASFQLSFFVVLSIALLLPPIDSLRRRLLQTDPLLPESLRPGWRRRLDRPLHYLTHSLATSLAAWLGSLPLIACYFHLLTPVSLPANLVIVPLAGLALMSNLGSLLCGDWWSGLGELFNFSGWFWMEAMIRLSEWFAALPGAYFHVKAPTWIGFVGYYALVFGTLTGWAWTPPRRRISAAALGSLAAVALLQWNAHRGETRISVLPLGGDSIYVDGPGAANDLLIDCASESAGQFVVKPFLAGQGVNRLPRLLLTHGDLRHIGGADLVQKEFPPRRFLVSSVPFRSPAYRRIVERWSAAPGQLQRVNRGDQFGAWTVLHPGSEDRYPEADDNALVLRAEFNGVRILFCSDLGRPGQGALLDRESDLRADVVVAGIPARGEPLGDALLDAVKPRVIIVSAGEVPAQETATRELRERLEHRGIPVFYTSDDGAATVTVRSKGWEVRAMGGKRFSAAGQWRPGSFTR